MVVFAVEAIQVCWTPLEMMPGVLGCHAVHGIVIVGGALALSVQLHQASLTLLLNVDAFGVGLFQSFLFGCLLGVGFVANASNTGRCRTGFCTSIVAADICLVSIVCLCIADCS